MKLTSAFKLLLPVLLLTLLTACIEIDDISDMWKKASLDPALEGTWSYRNLRDKDSDIAFISLTREKDYYVVASYDKNRKRFTEDDATFFAKTLRSGPNTYILLGNPRHPDKKDGMIFAYRFNGKTLETAWIRDCASCEHPSDIDMPPHLKKLDETTLKELDAVLASPPGWETWMVGEKLPDERKP